MTNTHKKNIVSVCNHLDYLWKRENELSKRDRDYLSYINDMSDRIVECEQTSQEAIDELSMIVGDTFGYEEMHKVLAL